MQFHDCAGMLCLQGPISYVQTSVPDCLFGALLQGEEEMHESKNWVEERQFLAELIRKRGGSALLSNLLQYLALALWQGVDLLLSCSQMFILCWTQGVFPKQWDKRPSEPSVSAIGCFRNVRHFNQFQIRIICTAGHM